MFPNKPDSVVPVKLAEWDFPSPTTLNHWGCIHNKSYSAAKIIFSELPNFLLQPASQKTDFSCERCWHQFNFLAATGLTWKWTKQTTQRDITRPPPAAQPCRVSSQRRILVWTQPQPEHLWSQSKIDFISADLLILMTTCTEHAATATYGMANKGGFSNRIWIFNSSEKNPHAAERF